MDRSSVIIQMHGEFTRHREALQAKLWNRCPFHSGRREQVTKVEAARTSLTRFFFGEDRVALGRNRLARTTTMPSKEAPASSSSVALTDTDTLSSETAVQLLTPSSLSSHAATCLPAQSAGPGC